MTDWLRVIIGLRQYEITKYSSGADDQEQTKDSKKKAEGKNLKYPPWV